MEISQEQRKLATEIAEAMRDTKSIVQYLKYVQQIPENVLRDFVVAILARSEIENRGAYFTTLVKQYVYKQKHDTRN